MGTGISVLAVSLDLTVLSIALPTLAHALNASESQLQWFTSSYALALTAALLPVWLLGGRYGRKKKETASRFGTFRIGFNFLCLLSFTRDLPRRPNLAGSDRRRCHDVGFVGFANAVL